MKKLFNLIIIAMFCLFGFSIISANNCGNCPPELSFLYDDNFAGVDNPVGWSEDDSMVELGKDYWNLFGNKAKVSSIKGDLTHRGTRGLGVYGGENDEVDSLNGEERIEITFNYPRFVNYIEVRSLFHLKSGELEEGEVELYFDGILQEYTHMVGTDNLEGVWSKTYDAIKVDKIVFYVDGSEDYADWSEFAVAKIGFECPCCEVIVDEPKEGEWYDPIDVEWHYEGYCIPSSYDLEYAKGTCGGNVWNEIIRGITTYGNPMFYAWPDEELPEDGDYCIRVRMDQAEGPHVSGYSGIFHLDLTPPESEISFGEPSVIIEDDPYINTNTPIYIDCEDDGSGVSEIFYEIYVEDGEGGWTLQHSYSEKAVGAPQHFQTEFNCHEESRHRIVYWCEDEVGKVEEPNEKIVFVDTTAPTIEKIIGEPKVEANIIFEENTYDWFVNSDTEICISAEDSEPHPVGSVSLNCWFSWNDGEGLNKPQKIQFDENGCFTYNEDSWHYLQCWAEDALGNEAYFNEWDIVDNQAPNTNLEFTGPQYEDCYSIWIDGISEVVLTAEDPEPHPVGGVETYYRYGIVDDKYCEGGQFEILPELESEFQKYEGPFSLEESCHMIEYYSIDALGNSEILKSKFVFVDKTAPTLNEMEVGEPNHDCNGLWEIITGKCEDSWDWIITTNTEVELSCTDEGPHPSGVEKLCWRMEWDGDDVTEDRCTEGDFEDGYCCEYADEVTVYFYEECEHLLEFYCVDHVEKISEPNSKYFKVEGEVIEIPIYKKWNLISIPFNLISNNIDEVFNQMEDKGVEIEGVWSYDEHGWHVYSPELEGGDLTTLEPGYGYWIKANCEEPDSDGYCADLVVGGSLLSPGPGLPPKRNLQKGWNLIGHYGTEPKSAYCSLFSLVDTTVGYPRWSSLYSFNPVSDMFKSLDGSDYTIPGKGYWIEMDVDDTYNPATACWGFY